MIILHKLNDDEFVLNSAHIETIEEKPDTVITLTNDRKYLVKESAEEINRKIIDYQQEINSRKGVIGCQPEVPAESGS